MLDVENTEGGKAIDFFAKFRLRIYTPKKKKKNLRHNISVTYCHETATFL